MGDTAAGWKKANGEGRKAYFFDGDPQVLVTLDFFTFSNCLIFQVSEKKKLVCLDFRVFTSLCVIPPRMCVCIEQDRTCLLRQTNTLEVRIKKCEMNEK